MTFGPPLWKLCQEQSPHSIWLLHSPVSDNCDGFFPIILTSVKLQSSWPLASCLYYPKCAVHHKGHNYLELSLEIAGTVHTSGAAHHKTCATGGEILTDNDSECLSAASHVQSTHTQCSFRHHNSCVVWCSCKRNGQSQQPKSGRGICLKNVTQDKIRSGQHICVCGWI